MEDNKGEIVTRLTNSENNYIISVYDNGIGFKDSGKFSQDDPYFTTKKNGSGLGLSIVSKIVHEHNGQIFYDNRTNSLGAFVTISLPKNYEKNTSS